MRRLSKFGLGALFAAGLGIAASPVSAQSSDIHHDRRDIRHDRQDIRSDRQDIHNKRSDLRNDYQSLKQNRATLRNDRNNGASSDQIKADRQAIRNKPKIFEVIEEVSLRSRRTWFGTARTSAGIDAI